MTSFQNEKFDTNVSGGQGLRLEQPLRPDQEREAETANAKKPEVARPKSEIEALRQALMQGDEALARRRDIGELHKRIVNMITTLNQGLDEKQAARFAEDKAHFVARLEQIERAVNSMEGALRVELEPLLHSMVERAVESRGTARPAKARIALQWLAAGVVGLVVGLGFSTEINAVYSGVLGSKSDVQSPVSPILFPDGGSEASANLAK
ncbi:hypothetical protein [Acidimangrovimonas pyrenivorans]|uniref:Uncharacterized protein n=1 Tax=Acidimangrovimonas pyrenivorans TaxID=2030798 RepID=A0ABV7AIL3_9RHOB